MIRTKPTAPSISQITRRWTNRANIVTVFDREVQDGFLGLSQALFKDRDLLVRFTASTCSTGSPDSSTDELVFVYENDLYKFCAHQRSYKIQRFTAEELNPTTLPQSKSKPLYDYVTRKANTRNAHYGMIPACELVIEGFGFGGGGR